MEKNDPPTSSYIYQCMDFDEGLLTYSETEPVETGDHPLSVQAKLRFNAGQARRKLDDFVGAASYYKKALRIFMASDLTEATPVSTFTAHRVVIPILHNIGQLSYKKGNLKKSTVAYKLALEHCRQHHGNEDLIVALSLNCLGVFCYHDSVNNSSDVIHGFTDAIKIQKRVLGPGSKDEATSLNNLGRVHVQREEYNEALYYYELALVIRRQCLERREYDKALALYQETLQVGRGALGEYHSGVAMLLNRIGNFHFEQENFDEALTIYKEGLRIERRVLDKTHPNIIVTLSNIGEIYRQQNKFSLAIRLYSDTMRLQQERYGESSAEISSTLNIIGLIYDQKGNHSMASKKLQDALVMRRRVLGDNHLEVSATLTHLGTILYRNNMISTAMNLFTESLRIRRGKLESDHRDVSFLLYNLGLCHQLQGSYKEAIECYSEALRVEKGFLEIIGMFL